MQQSASPGTTENPPPDNAPGRQVIGPATRAWLPIGCCVDQFHGLVVRAVVEEGGVFDCVIAADDPAVGVRSMEPVQAVPSTSASLWIKPRPSVWL